MASIVVPQAQSAQGAQTGHASPRPAPDRYRNIQVGLFVAGAVLLPFGLLVIGLGWYGSAHTPYLYNQMSYLVSGGLMGLGLTFAGGFLYFGAWLAKTAADQREAHRELSDALVLLADMVSKTNGGPAVAELRATPPFQTATPVRPAPMPAPMPSPEAGPVVAAPVVTAVPLVTASPVVEPESAAETDEPYVDGAAAVVDTSTEHGEPAEVIADLDAPERAEDLEIAAETAQTVEIPAFGEAQDFPDVATAAVEGVDLADPGALPVTVGSGTTVHRRDCQLIAHRSDLKPLTGTEVNPPTCRVCQPEV